MSPAAATEISDHLQPQLSRQVIAFTAQDSGTSERREMALLFPFCRQGATAGVKTSSRQPHKRFRSSALSSGVKKILETQGNVDADVCLHCRVRSAGSPIKKRKIDWTSSSTSRFPLSSMNLNRAKYLMYMHNTHPSTVFRLFDCVHSFQ